MMSHTPEHVDKGIANDARVRGGGGHGQPIRDVHDVAAHAGRLNWSDFFL